MIVRSDCGASRRKKSESFVLFRYTCNWHLACFIVHCVSHGSRQRRKHIRMGRTSYSNAGEIVRLTYRAPTVCLIAALMLV